MAVSISSLPRVAAMALTERAAGPLGQFAVAQTAPRVERIPLAELLATVAAVAARPQPVVALAVAGVERLPAAALVREIPLYPARLLSSDAPLAQCCAAAPLSPDNSRLSSHLDPADRGSSDVPKARSDRSR